MTRQDAKALTRKRLLAEAQRLFRERGYGATSLEQVAEAAQVTKGAIYGHFSSKEDLLLSAAEAEPPPAWAIALNDPSRPLRGLLADFSGAMAVDEEFTDKAGLAVELEFLAALLRSPAALARYSAGLHGRLAELAADDSQPLPGTSPVQTRAIRHALLIGLQAYRCIAPEVVTPEAFGRAFELLAGAGAGGRE